MGKNNKPDPPSLQKYGVPFYSAAFIPYNQLRSTLQSLHSDQQHADSPPPAIANDYYAVLAGGGGEGRSGIPNAALVVHFDFASNSLSAQPEVTSRKDQEQYWLSSKDNIHGYNIQFVDFKIGADSGYIRFEEPEAAQKARAAAVLAKEGGLSVKNFIATLEPVTGDAEKEYWTLLRGNQKETHDKSQSLKGGKHFRGGGKHGRSRDKYSAGGRSNKAQKVGAS